MISFQLYGLEFWRDSATSACLNAARTGMKCSRIVLIPVESPGERQIVNFRARPRGIERAAA
jgi:hypothetical protein